MNFLANNWYCWLILTFVCFGAGFGLQLSNMKRMMRDPDPFRSPLKGFGLAAFLMMAGSANSILLIISLIAYFTRK